MAHGVLVTSAFIMMWEQFETLHLQPFPLGVIQFSRLIRPLLYTQEEVQCAHGEIL